MRTQKDQTESRYQHMENYTSTKFRKVMDIFRYIGMDGGIRWRNLTNMFCRKDGRLNQVLCVVSKNICASISDGLTQFIHSEFQYIGTDCLYWDLGWHIQSHDMFEWLWWYFFISRVFEWMNLFWTWTLLNRQRPSIGALLDPRWLTFHMEKRQAEIW